VSSRTLAVRRDEALGNGPRICLFGAAPDVGNHGLNALMLATLDGVTRRHPDAWITVFDNGLGRRRQRFGLDDRTVEVDCVGFRGGHRYYRPENHLTTRFAARSGLLGNPGAAALASADVVLDISAGDSFTDLYGAKRFTVTVAGKRIALATRRPLVLLPQTYGPFLHRRSLDRATTLLRGSAAAWARGADSYRRMVRMLGPDHDPSRHHLGVDMAFTLCPVSPDPVVVEQLEGTLEVACGAPVAGLNVSGLLYERPDVEGRYGLTADYRSAVQRIAERIVASGGTVLLVPHVGSDVAACRALRDTLDDPRVVLAPPGLDAAETKWLIGRTDFFCGTRMHSTIAALTSRVPTCAVAYSLKTTEVFGTLGVAERVADARRCTTEQLVEQVMRGWDERAAIGAVLERSAPVAIAAARTQQDAILDTVDQLIGVDT